MISPFVIGQAGNVLFHSRYIIHGYLLSVPLWGMRRRSMGICSYARMPFSLSFSDTLSSYTPYEYLQSFQNNACLVQTSM